MNPIELARKVEERYRNYLKTTFYFKDPQLRKSFEDALDSGHLCKGPYIEATPVFKRGKKTSELFSELLGSKPDDGFIKAIGDRHLYKHQEEAIRRAFAGNNVVVATGTGSGKTEVFFYPILLHLYQEFRSGNLGPGVRALILYPMNALANDQKERLGQLCKALKDAGTDFHLTFGQYIGETPEDENDFQRHAHDHLDERREQGNSILKDGQVIHGELVLRSEMRHTPPHILLTNYSMLEYLLLRPDDSPLFDNGNAQWWKFLVLDEAHQYRGSRGIEMAMLMRRLKQRLREGGRKETFCCIATSATLVGQDSDRATVAQFASALFGEKFQKEDIILGDTIAVSDPGPKELSLEDYRWLKDSIDNIDQQDRSRLAEIASRVGVQLSENEKWERAVGRILETDGRSTKLRLMLTGNPVEVPHLANELFPNQPKEERISALTQLVELLIKAKNPESGDPILSARYHIFLRSLEGAFVSLWPENKVFLDRKTIGEETSAFEVALCRECGQHYFVTSKNFKQGKVQEAIRDPNNPDFGVTFLRPIETDEEEVEGNESDRSQNMLFLCIKCGEAQPHQLTCGHNKFIRIVKEAPPEDDDRADQLAKCGVCGYTGAGRDPVREVIHGTDGPHAVIATTLYQNLPEERRKVLAFADGRQEAAFFAWYLESSYRDILNRNLILSAVKTLAQHAPEGLSLKELARELCHIFQDHQIFPPSMGGLDLRREAWIALYRELLTDEQRISLEGVASIRWSIKWPDWFKIPEILKQPPWSLDEREALDLMLLLLDTMRTSGAVELRTESGISLNWNDLNLQASQTRFRIGARGNPRGVKSWDGKGGTRARFLAKLLMKEDPNISKDKALKIAEKTLQAIWESTKQCEERASNSNSRLLLAINDARRLNPDWWRLHLIGDNDTIFQCNLCGRIQALSVRGICARHGCSGMLEPKQLRDLQPNHYRELYNTELPGLMRVEEHTAQLDKEKAREFQREFRNGKIHILSCSTTFELGVDLGDLDVIFLRNVPPEAFNYAQRVGRAGRRSGNPGFAITFCRRAPHDLYHFSEPERMLSGKVRPPILTLCNEKIITRHIVALTLSYYFRTFPERFKNVESLFIDLQNPTGVTDFKSFLNENWDKLENSIRAIVPDSLINHLGLHDRSLVDRITGTESRFALAEAEISSDYKTVIQLEEIAKNNKKYLDAEWARKRAETIASEDVLSFLSRKTVIPKYGFPVDVVELDVQRTQQNKEAFEVLLQRDLSIAISEFAPTSKIIANKKLWTSYGLKKVAEKIWPKRYYKKCTRHNIFIHWEEGKEEPATPCGDKLHAARYIIPRFGFITDRDGPEEPKSRTVRVFTTRPYFAGPCSSHESGEILVPQQSPAIRIKKASPGLMVVLCEGQRGRGFYICRECGAGFKKQTASHNDPYGQTCSGTLEQVSLGHEFVTDVLQLQFLVPPKNDIDSVWFAYALAYALVEGAAEELEIPPSDLNATVAYSAPAPVLPIIIYDDLPGGAGIVARLENEVVLRACLTAAQKRVSGVCGCDENTSCYGCLRNYRNQFAHEKLKRGPVYRYLEQILSRLK
ncbi:MAG: DEAD/DEAH box helicase [candidate division WOR-3 bacterium]|uniref:DEAD/DEAH box helicase n=1 Tax=candidate division WOR-3 bacterium TaxID=2052148 RepID=A0A7C1NMF5_UNCW3|nr:DEAD/DEAH box helicase [candidate division WOR-3 bacterium]